MECPVCQGDGRGMSFGGYYLQEDCPSCQGMGYTPQTLGKEIISGLEEYLSDNDVG